MYLRNTHSYGLVNCQQYSHSMLLLNDLTNFLQNTKTITLTKSLEVLEATLLQYTCPF